MRLTINKEELYKGLATAGHAIGAKSANPVLMTFKLEVTSRGLEITGTDSDLTVFTLVPNNLGDVQIIRGSAPGAILIPARTFLEAARRIDGAETTIEVVDGVARVSAGRALWNFPCIDANQYPDILLDEGESAFEIPVKSLAELVDQTSFAAPLKSSRPILTGISLKAAGGVLTATATDSARLSRKSVAVPRNVEFSAVVPAKTLSGVVRMLDGYETVRVSCAQEKMVFAFGNTIVSCSLLSGEYPIGDRIIPTTFNYHLEANALELLSAIERMSILNSDKAPVVKLTMTRDKVEVSTRSDQNGSGAECLQNFQYTGERLEITFNSTFISDAVKAVRGVDVLISFVGEMKPFVIKNPTDDSVVELVTPMRTR